MSPATLDWSTAEVHDGRLTVELQGELPEGWKQSFLTTVKLLGHSEWGELGLEERTIEVGDVPGGSEDKLRHFLQGAVDQANASTGPDEEQENREREQDAQDAGREDPDAQMTERFRSFGAPAPDEEQEDERAH